MKSKRLIIISIFLIFLCLNVVSASDNADNGVIATQDDNSIDTLTLEQNNILSDGETGNFTELSEFLSGKSEVTLQKDYKCVDGESVITLSNITINGNGHKIDADKKTGIFSIKQVSGNQVTLNNITFLNANTERGGAIDQAGNKANIIDLTVTNSYFINNTVSGTGGSIYSNCESGSMTFENNTFINSTAKACGAVYVSSNNVKSFYNNIFINNTALSGNAGALQVGANVLINKSKFINNIAAKQYGGAIFSSASNLNVIDSEFINNSAKNSEGGAIYSSGSNLKVIDSEFINNMASNQGGAIYSSASNLKVIDSEFINNSAKNSEGGAIYAGAKNLQVNNSKFDSNLARYGGAISSHSANSNITYSNFTNNIVKFEKSDSKDGPRGAGIYFGIASTNSFVSNCYFELNNVVYDKSNDHLGGGIYIGSDNVIVTDSVFKNNDAAYGGGVYSAQGANNTLIKNCNFIDNHAQDTGAGVSSVGPNPTISYCNFTNNDADKNAGGLYVDLRSAEEGAKENEAHVSHCSFIENNAFYAGGGIHLRDRHSKGFTVFISDCLFENNTANIDNISKSSDIRGGAGVSLNGPANITNCKFNGNNATRGSAIRLASDISTTVLYLENTVFGKNRANSTSLEISVDKPVSYYPSNVTINVTLRGYDNIANAIWNEKSSEYVYTSNITYDAFIGGELVTVQTPVGFKVTADGYGNSDDGSLVWQDDRENAQNITLKIYKVEDTTLNTLGSGVLSVSNMDLLKVNTEEFIYGTNVPLTDLSGTLSNIQRGLKPGNYTVKASHAGDAYYTEIENQAKFEILALNITKTTDDILVGVTDNVTYTIEVKNPSNGFALSGVNIRDDAPEGFELLDYSNNWSSNDNIIFTYNGLLNPGETIKLNLIYKATEVGTFNNTVTLKTNESDPINTTSENTTVVPCILTVNKTADVTVLGNNSLVKYTILVNNTGIFNATNVTVVDTLQNGLTYVNQTSNVTKGVNFKLSGDRKTLTWTVDNLTDAIEFYVTVRTATVGNLTNNVAVNCNENKTKVNSTETVEVVPENVNVVKTANVTECYVDGLVKFTINVTNTGRIAAKDINVTDILDSAFEVQKIGNESYLKYNDTEMILWNIPSLDVGNSTTLEVTVKVLTNGTFNNTASVITPNSNETTSTVNVTAEKIPTHVSVGNITTYPDKDITIPINVTADDNKTFSGNVTITFPDGSNQTVEIINGNGKVTWHVPANYTPDVYNDTVKFSGDDKYLPSSGNGTVEVIPVPTTTIVGNVTGRAGQNVTIPVNVTADDNKTVNGNVTITLPDGSNQTVEIINGTGNVTWTIPDDYNGTYTNNASYPGNNTYLPSNGTGVVNVIPKIPTHVSVGKLIRIQMLLFLLM